MPIPKADKIGWALILGLVALALAMVLSARIAKAAPSDGPIMRALLSLPTFHEDTGAEHAQEKRAQLITVANAIGAAAKGDKDLAAMLVTVAYHESAMSLRIHAGQCKPSECDHGLAASIFQLHSSKRIPLDEWATLASLDPEATKLAAKRAAQMLIGARYICGRDPARIMTSFAGLRCDAPWAGLAPRLQTFAKIRGRL